VPDTPRTRHAHAVAALERLGNIALRGQSMESVLRTVADLAKDVLPGDPEVSISLLANDKASTAVSTGKLAMDLDESQYGRGYGPCLHAASTGELTEVHDSRTDPRWPDYGRTAWERGSGSSLSVPLPIHEGLSGALNIYAREAHAFDDEAARRRSSSPPTPRSRWPTCTPTRPPGPWPTTCRWRSSRARSSTRPRAS